MKKSAHGFTLIELIVTMTITSMIVIGVISLFLTIQTTQRRVAQLETATRAAQKQIESLRNNNYNSLAPNTTLSFTNELPSSLPSPKSGTVLITEPTAGLRRVDVTIHYEDGSYKKDVKLSSFIGVLGIGQ